MANTVEIYTFNTRDLPHEETAELQPGCYAGVHFVVTDPDLVEEILRRIEVWYDGCDEVILVDSGVSASGKGFVIMEWDQCEIDTPFIEVLRNSLAVEDWSPYIRDSGV